MTRQNPIILKPPTGDIPKDKIGEMLADAPSSDEVAGREMQFTYVQCPQCGAVRPVIWDLQKYQGYSCPNCGTTGLC